MKPQTAARAIGKFAAREIGNVFVPRVTRISMGGPTKSNAALSARTIPLPTSINAMSDQ